MSALINTRHPTVSPPQQGFSLVELAVVLFILTLLGAGSLLPLGSRLEAARLHLTRQGLDDIEQALYGFALIYGRLPCPSPPATIGSSDEGVAPEPPCASLTNGLLPWRSLGVSAVDGWGEAWRYQVDAAFSETTISTATTPSSDLQIFDHEGSRLTLIDSQAVAVVFSSGPNRRPDGRNADQSTHPRHFESGEHYADFDDQLRWLGRPLLLARLAQGGRL